MSSVVFPLSSWKILITLKIKSCKIVIEIGISLYALVMIKKNPLSKYKHPFNLQSVSVLVNYLLKVSVKFNSNF